MAQVAHTSRGGVRVIRTSRSAFAKHWDLRLVLSFHCCLPLVCLGDFVDIWLLPGHFLHERLQGMDSFQFSANMMV